MTRMATPCSHQLCRKASLRFGVTPEVWMIASTNHDSVSSGQLALARETAGHSGRRAWDSNPQVLSDNGFQDRPLAS
jgi:hypothetical protein